MNISVVIPVYKQTEQFLANLKVNSTFLKNVEIIVVNDDPTTSIATHLKEFDQVILIEHNENKGFGPTVNDGVKKAKGNFILLLNSDVLLQDNSYKKAIDAFTDPSVFAVSFAQKEQNGEIVGKNRIYWKNGFILHSKAADLTSGINAWAEGGSCMIDKKKFEKLKGFDDVYSPFYWEDIDLSYRAWKKGYTVQFDADIVVQHHHETTIGSLFKKKQIQQIAYRNQLLFHWKNITDTNLIFSFILHLHLFILKSIVKGNNTFLKGYIQALFKLPTAMKGRFNNSFSESDNEILRKFN